MRDKWIFLCLAAAWPVAAFDGPGEARTATEEQMRAGFLFQLAQYANWPKESLAENAPLRFCVVAQDGLVETLEATVQGKNIQGHRIAVSRAKEIADLVGCHLGFIGFRRAKQVREALARWQYPPVLLVGETDQFAESGGMVNLVIKSGRVSFEINVSTADRAHIAFRSQLLRFAKIVGGEGK